MQIYQNFGPFEIPRTNGHASINRHELPAFWRQTVNTVAEGLAHAKGLYVFAMRAGRGLTPWYVGKANGRKGFEQEALNFRNIVTYGEVMQEYKSGSPVLFLIARQTRTKRNFSRTVKESELSWAEKRLIVHAADANPRLKNIHGNRNHRECCIPGVINDRKRVYDDPTNLLLRTLNLRPIRKNGCGVENLDDLKDQRDLANEQIVELEALPDETQASASVSPDTESFRRSPKWYWTVG